MSTVSPTDSLPPEILLKIFHLLSPRHLKRVVLVCRWWRKVGEDPALWGWVSLIVTRDNLSSMPEMLDTRRLETAPCLLVWHGVTVSDQLLQAVGRHSGLKTLNLVNTNLSSVEAGLLASTVARMETVSVSGQYQCPECPCQHCHVETATVNEGNLTREQWEALFTVLSGGEAQLKSLDIYGNNLSRVTPQLLASAITKLETVDICCTALTSQQCEVLFTAISEGSQLRSLHISGNDLSTVTPLLLATVESKLETDIRQHMSWLTYHMRRLARSAARGYFYFPDHKLDFLFQ